jgi:diguanylate cyclase (GGDEF)-like protein/PAS domain S-box-containing protein
MFNILSLISFSNAVFFIFLAIYSILGSRKSSINQASCVECFLLGIWSFSYTFFYVAPSKEAAWFWLRVGSVGWIGFMGALVWFFLALTRYNKKEYKLIKIVYSLIVPIVLIVLNFFMPYTSAAVDLDYSSSGLGWGYINHINNGLYWFYIVYILFGIFICIYILVSWLKNSKSKHFRRLAITFLTLDGVLIFCGFCFDLIIPMFTDAIPPLTNIVLVIFSFSYWVIIVEMDVFKKTAIEASEFILDTIRDALMVLDEQGRILHCNKATSMLLKYPINEIIGEKLVRFLTKNDYDGDSVQHLITEKKLVHRQTDLVAKDGTLIHTTYSASVAEDDIHGFMGIIISFHDITKQKELEFRLYELAHYDALTGLPNRRFFIDMLYSFEEIYQKNQQDFAILFMDLDGFKKINDTMGHDMGDALLIEVGKRIKSCIEDADIIARIGGDEFIMLQAYVENEEQVKVRKAKILQQFESEIIINNQKCPIGISIGYAIYSKTKDISDILNEADKRMYEEKIGNREYRK